MRFITWIFGYFWNSLTNPNPSPMVQMINDSCLVFNVGFPISVQCADTVLTCGTHFDHDIKEFSNMNGELIAKLDAVAISHALQIP